MDAYLGVTCHYLSDSLDLTTVLLGVQYFPLTHTAANFADAIANLMTEWGITEKVCGMVTDGYDSVKHQTHLLFCHHV